MNVVNHDSCWYRMWLQGLTCDAVSGERGTNLGARWSTCCHNGIEARAAAYRNQDKTFSTGQRGRKLCGGRCTEYWRQ
ncbi:unnamed protein product [Lathyrus sativus]|nr:unnamed protein product [Lathyrus sativus]